MRTVLVLGLLLVPLAAAGLPASRVHRVGIIMTTTPVSDLAGPEPAHPAVRALVHGLRELGYVEGQNLILERRSAEGRWDRLGAIVSELVQLKADVIVSVSNTVTREATAVTTIVPIVMAASLDPVEAGFAQSLARPGGNVTGLTWAVDAEIDAKRLELFREVLPRASRVAYLGTKSEWDGPWATTVQTAAKTLGMTLFLAEHTPDDYTRAFAGISRARPDALFVSVNPASFAHRQLIVDFATRHRLPDAHAFRESVEAGGLMSYGVNAPDLFRRAAGYVDRILKGARPGDLPIEQPTKFELVVNLKTAKALGLTLPQSILLRADHLVD